MSCLLLTSSVPGVVQQAAGSPAPSSVSRPLGGCPPGDGVAALSIGTRVRNKRTGELGTVVVPRDSTVKLREVAVEYDDCPDISWATKPSAVEIV